MVSRHLVDWIEIIGIVLMLLSTLALARDQLGRAGPDLLRRALVGVVYGSYVATQWETLATLHFVFVGKVSISFAPAKAYISWIAGWTERIPAYGDMTLGNSFVVVVLIYGATALIFGIFMGGKESSIQRLAGFSLLAGFAYLFLMIPDSIIVYFAVNNSLAYAIGVLLAFMFMSAVSLLAFVILNIASKTNEHDLGMIGLALAVLGILSTFLSPILDLLNIPVK